MQKPHLPPTPPGEIPWQELAAPARRALSGAGYATLADLAKVSETQIYALHGVGPRAMFILRRALANDGLTFLKTGVSE